jgi:hypothetical protein
MPTGDGITCGSCLTLNPAAAPACVRCNSPLTRAAAPLPAAAARVDSFRAEQEVRPAPPPDRVRRDDRLRGLSPAAQRHIVRRIELVGGIIVVLVLVVGGLVVWRHAPRKIDPGPVETEISTQLGRQLSQQVRVDCPDDVTRRAGATFTCTATDAAGDDRTVEVTVTGSDGSYRWQLR